MPHTTRKALFTLFAAFFFVTTACGGTIALPEAPIDQAELPAQIDAPAQESDALEPLDPLPEFEEIVPEATVTFDEATTAEQAEFILGKARWEILQTAELGDSLVSDTADTADLIANGRLIGVRFEIENLGDDPLTFVGLSVVDEAGNRYAYLSDGLAFIVPEEACEVVTLEPATAVTCTAIYDVPADAAPLYAVLTDLALLGGAQEQVDLGL